MSESVGDGEALADVVGVGASGSVGVGTGGIVRGGNRSSDASVGGVLGVPAGAAVSGPDAIGPTGVDTARVGMTDGLADATGAADDATTGVAGLKCRAGATPMPPAPPGASMAAERVAGVASCQPMVTATGSPSATSPKKMDLGDNRT
jgi:hypothetical protein